MVRKAEGSWRLCGDFRRLNLVTEPDVYPLPNMLDFAAKAAGCTVFSKIDLRKGYHQIPVNPADEQKTAINTPFGLFEYKRMPFGLRNAGPSFQQHVDRAIRDCIRNHEEHVIHVREVLQALQDNKLVVHAEKCVWGVQELEYLGHKISAAGLLPLPSHVAAIQELQAFLGMVNFYRRFLPSIARNAAAADGRAARGQEGGRQTGVVGGNGCRLCSRLAVSPHSNTHGTSHSGGGAVGGCGRLGDARRGVSAASATWQEGVAAFGLLLKEARGCPAEIFRLRQGVICLFCRDPPLQVHAGRQAVRHLHGPQAAHLCTG